MKKIIVALLSLVLVVSFSMGTASAANSLREGSKGISVGFGDSVLGLSVATLSGRYFTSNDFALLAGFGFQTSSGDIDQDFLGLAFGVRKYFAVDDFAPFFEGLISYEKLEEGVATDEETLNFILGFGGEYFFARQFSMEGSVAFVFGKFDDNTNNQDATFFGTASLGLSANFYF